jgi:ribonuclease D
VDIRPLRAVLDSGATAVIHAAEQDFEVLRQACGTVPAELFDTQIAAGFLGYSSPSLSTLLERVLRVQPAKSGRMTDWTDRPLGSDQLAYAVADVAHLLQLHDVLVEELEARGRREWATEECAALRRVARLPVDPETAWWKLKDSRNLRGHARGVAQAVAAWRERRAATLDRPTRTVLSDLAISAIAHRPPQDLAALEAMRGIELRHVKGEAGRQILGAVEEGRRLPAERVRQPPVDRGVRGQQPALALAAAWVVQMARDLEIDPPLLATRLDLQQLLAGDGSGRLVRGWRAEVVGEPMARLLAGEMAIAIEGGQLVAEPRAVEPRSTSAERNTTAPSGPTTPG